MTEDTPEYETIEMNVVKFDVNKAAIAVLGDKYKGFEDKDLDDKDEFELVRLATTDLRTKRTSVETKRKELKAGALAYGKQVDAAANELKNSIKVIEDPIAIAFKAHKEKKEIAKREAIRKEEERIDAIAAKIAAVNAIPGSLVRADSAAIAVAITNLERGMYNFDEFKEKGDAAIASVTETLNSMYDEAVLAEENARKVEKMEAEAKAVKEKAEADERIRVEEQKKAQDEQQAIMDKQQADINAQQAKIEAQQAEIEAEKAKVAQAETDRINAEQDAIAAKVIAEEKARVDAEEAKQAKILQQERLVVHETRKLDTVKDLMGVIESQKVAADLLDRIIAGKVANVEWVK